MTTVLATHDVEEAPVLTERVIVLGDRQASIRAEVGIDVPCPPHRDDPRRLRRAVLGILGHSA